MVLLVGAARTSSGTGVASNPSGIEEFYSALFFLNVTAVSGTVPTLQVYVQMRLPDGIAWQDIVSFTLVTAAGKQVAGVTPNGAFTPIAQQVGALAPGSVNNLPLGEVFRIQWVIGGTAPSFTFAVYASLQK